MPTIPIITAEGKAAVQQLPAQVPVQSYAGMYNSGQSITQFGQQLDAIAQHLQREQNQLESADLIGKFSGGLKELAVAVRKEVEDPLQRGVEFAKRARVLQQDLSATAKNKIIATDFATYAERHLPVETAKVHHDGLKYLGQQQLAKIDAMEGSTSRLASLADTPEERDKWLRFFDAIVDGGVKEDLLDPVQGQHKKDKFKVRAQVDFMEHLALNDTEKLKDLEKRGEFSEVPTHARDLILQKADRIDNAKMIRIEHEKKELMKQSAEAIDRYIVSQFRAERLTAAMIEEWQGFTTGHRLNEWHEMLRAQTLGIGNAGVERETAIDARNDNLSIQGRIDATHTLYKQGLISKQTWDQRVSRLQADKNRDESQAHADKNSDESKILALKIRRANEARGRLKDLLQTSSPFEKFNEISATVTDEALTEFDNNVDANNAQGKDGEALYRMIKPKVLVKVRQRMDPIVNSLEADLQRYPNKASLEAARGTMSDYDFNQLVLKQRELYAIRTYLNKLGQQQKNEPKVIEEGR